MNKQKEKSIWKDIYYHTDWSFIINLSQLIITLCFLKLPFEYSTWLYIVKIGIIISYRLLTYKSIKSYYYMYELYYWIDIFSAFFLLLRMFNILPQEWNEYFFRFFYIYTHGSIIYVFSNKVVVHNTQYMISIFIHSSSPIIFWRYRWNWDINALENYQEINIEKNISDWINGSYKNIKLITLSYLLWMCVFTIILFSIRKNRIDQVSYKTMYNYILNNPKNLITRLINFFKFNNTKVQKTIYLAYHMLFNIFGILLTGLWFNSFVLDTIFIIGVNIYALYFVNTQLNY